MSAFSSLEYWLVWKREFTQYITFYYNNLGPVNQNKNAHKNEYYLIHRFKPLFLDWLQPLKQLFINVSYHILVTCLTLMALF